MKRFVRCSGIGLLAIVAGCQSTQSSPKELNLFAWSEYVPQAVIDGFAEETGIQGRVLVELGTIDFWFAAGDRRIHKYVHHFLLEAVGGYLTIENDPDHEAIDVAWLPLQEAHRHLTFPNERRIARLAWQRLSGDAG